MSQRPVFWGQGAFLTPQHLQAQEDWLRDYSLRLHQLQTPYPTGFCQLRLDETALDSGMVELLDFGVYNRRGEWLCATTGGQGNAHVPSRSLLELEVRGNQPIALYLALSQARSISGLEALPEDAGDALPARHRLHSEPLADPFDPRAPEAELDYLIYQARIVSSLDDNIRSILQHGEALQFAEILPNGPGRFRLSGDYIPPCVRLGASSVLARWTRNLRDLLLSRGHEFASVKRQRGIRSASTSAQEVMRVLMMQTFARYIPVLQEHARLESTPPWLLYQELRRLVAEFSVFSEDIGYCGELRGQGLESELPVYDPDNLRHCFRNAFERAEILIKSLMVGTEIGLPLIWDGRYYKAELPPALFESDKTRFYLAFDCDLSGEELTQRLQRTGKISSLDEMPRLLQSALFGLKIDLLPAPPEELPQRSPNTTYFLIDTRHPFWQMIRERRTIAISADLPADSTAIKLYPVHAQE
ncbi:type VI secretion system baseplate subunit TssK [Azotobacter chroococcum]|uniref:type VI secretion system baseplate subunit TssK n=1 Tax=Azotobacter chroococcum TaxID=353 RepID=UPI00146BE2DF|nr:type VI secretion system baseplate subunit TssK [Azotobacter chroococcum]